MTKKNWPGQKKITQKSLCNFFFRDYVFSKNRVKNFI